MSTGDAPGGRARDVLWQAWDEPGLEHLTLLSLIHI